ncbi:zinc finger CCCH domain-containing protein 44 isoform X1 [Cucumis melo]|uniref:Zinc finger CCCH domain-containing protein 44 isoform X1 n=1 Tax=Cucumis melo TaxID=3656 RepID=A0A1S3BWX1_CUCME|nr:zinc finger CCCH domain-containing protein 44 isoform X1 [Cucumis melo]
MDKPHDPSLDFNKPRLQSHEPDPPPPPLSANSIPPPPPPLPPPPDLMDLDPSPANPRILDSQLSADSALNAKLKDKVVVVGTRRRGRPPRAQLNLPPPPLRQKKDEEDVCFICFDGGSLVLCDRRGCPKAYHPSCIKRDESFFRSKAKWNCGWHICTSCQKASYYMCYTCPFSLCKGCIKGADYQCVRGSKGFCGTCMKIIMLIEKRAPDGESVQVDFDDKSSWEYLFKVYWIYLKEKLSLTVDELVRAKNSWQGSTIMDHRVGPNELLNGSIDKSQGAHNSYRNPKSQRKRPNRQQGSLNKFSSLVDRPSSNEQLSGSTKWGTTELMDLVAHMRNGDTTRLSPLDVQALLLEYVKKNNLRDPQQQSQIICDFRLTNLFGKSRIGHFEMLNLLQSHVHGKETAADNVTSSGAGIVINPVESKEKHDAESVDDCERKRKTHKKADESREQLHAIADGYAAIDAQNINLIYLQRDLIMSLIDDEKKFNDMVVGSIVRIQIPNNDEKHDFHRLVQVVGTSKISTPYTVGEKTIDAMLDILNLDKRESVSIEGISNQEFTEEECRRLRRSIKCGLVKRFSVSEILDKGRELHALKINDMLQKEISRLTQLQVQASEKGNVDELRDVAERLHRLKSPGEEHQHRLLENLEVRSDPTMDPNYESEEDKDESNKKRQGSLKRSRNCDFDEKEVELTSPRRGANSNVCAIDVQKDSTSTSEQSINISLTAHVNKEGDCLPSDRICETSWAGRGLVPNNWNVPSQAKTATPVSSDGNYQVVLPEASIPPLSIGLGSSSNDAEVERIWQYQEPTGKVCGPFSMTQLRNWNNSGQFTPDLRVWRITESQNDSVLLTNALNGCYNKASSIWQHNNHLLSLGRGSGLSLGGSDNHHNGQSNGGTNSSTNFVRFGIDSTKNRNSEQKDHIAVCDAENEPMISTGSSSPSKDFCAPADTVNSIQSPRNLEVAHEPLKNSSSWSYPSLMNLLSSATLSLQPPVTEVPETKENHSPNNEDQNSQTISLGGIHSQSGRKKRSSSEDCSSQSSGQNWIAPPATDASSREWNSNCSGLSLMGSFNPSEKIREILPNIPHSTPKPITGDVDIKHSASSSVLVQNSGPSWSSASSLPGGRQLPNHLAPGGWGDGYMAAPGRPIEDLNSSFGLKSSDIIDDHETTAATINWGAIDDDSNDFNSLVDESVSDLLAEVEAMECLSGLASSASMMNCSEGLTRDSSFFSVDDGFNPAAEMGKVDALSSTANMQFPYHIRVKDEQP